LIARAEAVLFLKFAVVGALGFVTDGGLLALGLHSGLSVGVARAISLGVALHLTFLLNGAFVFRTLRPAALPRQWATYMLANGAGALCNYLVFLGLIASRAPVLSDRPTAFVIAAVVALGVNFTGSRLVAFKA
jgi:putative flippase GtrA